VQWVLFQETEKLTGGIAALAGDQEEILFAQLDLEECQRLRQEKQYLPLRRPEVFELN